jgi:prepilin-type N-terminal cleavage/methylation domain-containing protein
VPVHDRRPSSASDAGFSLIEVMATTAVMAVVLAMFGGAVVQVYRGANHEDSMSLAQAQLHDAFIRLDRDIRYASGISAPGLVGGTRYVEYVITNTGVSDCTQLRLTSGGLLQSRAGRAGAQPTAWSTIASYLTPPLGFTRSAATSSGAPYQQLSVQVTVRAGNGGTAVSRQARYTFTALNTTADTRSDSVCSQMGRS